MPYIPQEKRDFIDNEIADLAVKIANFSTQAARPGVMNYAITQLIATVYNLPDKQSYGAYNEITGVLECCKLEFYSTFVSTYEELKRQENGDIIAIKL